MKRALLISISLGAIVCAGFAQEKDCCAAEAKAPKAQAKQDGCGDMAKSGCGKTMSAEDQFLAEAKKMMVASQKLEKLNGAEECCQSTSEHPKAKGDEGCCNTKGEIAKFKVYIAGMGYKFFGCEESAEKGRTALIAKHSKVGGIQKVTSKVAIS